MADQKDAPANNGAEAPTQQTGLIHVESAPAQPAPPWNGSVKEARYCHRCCGMVNGNGCGLDECPIR